MHSRIRTLIAEDSKGVSEVVKMQLESLGCETVVVTTVAGAKEHVKNVDLVILDLHLDDGHGSEIVKQMGEEENYAPIVVMTGYQDLKDNLDRSRILYWLDKPFSLQIMKSTMQKAVEVAKNIISITEDVKKIEVWNRTFPNHK